MSTIKITSDKKIEIAIEPKKSEAADIYEVARINERNIVQALEDYGKHTLQTDELDAVSNTFIRQLAHDAAYRKQDLRKILRKCKGWNEELQAVVYDGEYQTEINEAKVINYASRILIDIDDTMVLCAAKNFIEWACGKADDPGETFMQIAPKAYAKGKKPSRVFKAFCDAIGVTNDAAGSEFQWFFAKFADELNPKNSVHLYISINPAHFLTMSNPKEDRRGCTLTSCHSFNSTSYSYNNGCSGYARDDVTMIVFTASDPDDPETLNNRKTNRQIFTYRVGSGIIMQSRLYTTSGGMSDDDHPLFPVFRDVVQRVISEGEEQPNLWVTSKLETKKHYISTHSRFGGYADWEYSAYGARISIRKGWEDVCMASGYVVGNAGLCIECGEETSYGLRCSKCNNEEKCYDCCKDVDEDYLLGRIAITNLRRLILFLRPIIEFAMSVNS